MPANHVLISQVMLDVESRVARLSGCCFARYRQAAGTSVVMIIACLATCVSFHARACGVSCSAGAMCITVSLQHMLDADRAVEPQSPITIALFCLQNPLAKSEASGTPATPERVRGPSGCSLTRHLMAVKA